MSSRPTLDLRAKSHLSYFAYVCHRFSGLLLACFIPLHFFNAVAIFAGCK